MRNRESVENAIAVFWALFTLPSSVLATIYLFWQMNVDVGDAPWPVQVFTIALVIAVGLGIILAQSWVLYRLADWWVDDE